MRGEPTGSPARRTSSRPYPGPSEEPAGWWIVRMPTAGSEVLTSSVITLREPDAPPAGFEPAHTAPEADALSPELRGLGADTD